MSSPPPATWKPRRRRSGGAARTEPQGWSGQRLTRAGPWFPGGAAGRADRAASGLDIDLATDMHAVSLERHETDIAIRLNRPDDGDVIARPLTTIGYGFYGTPAACRRMRMALSRPSSASTKPTPSTRGDMDEAAVSPRPAGVSRQQPARPGDRRTLGRRDRSAPALYRTHRYRLAAMPAGADPAVARRVGS